MKKKNLFVESDLWRRLAVKIQYKQLWKTSHLVDLLLMKIQFFLQLQVFKGIPSEASFVSFDLMGTILVERMRV